MRRRYLESLGVPEVLRDRIDGRRSPPYSHQRAGGFHVPVPPAFTALWGDFDTSVGIWFHWFSDRTLSFVRLFHDVAFLCLEKARNYQQFSEEWVINEICDCGGIEPEIEDLAKELGLTQNVLEFLDIFSSENDGDQLLPCFRSETPLASVETLDNYDGEFPTVVLAQRHRWDACCEIEARGVLSDHRYEDDPQRYADGVVAWQEHLEASPWLRDDSHKPDVFKHYVKNEDWGKAWLSINSHGWKLSEVSDALHELNRRTRAPGFDLAVSAWHEGWARMVEIRDYY